MNQQGQQLVLVRARKSRPSGQWGADDYDVRFADAEGEVIGRIMRHPQAPSGQPWFWTVTAHFPHPPTSHGYCATREEAMAAFKAAWCNFDQ